MTSHYSIISFRSVGIQKTVVAVKRMMVVSGDWRCGECHAMAYIHDGNCCCAFSFVALGELFPFFLSCDTRLDVEGFFNHLICVQFRASFDYCLL